MWAKLRLTTGERLAATAALASAICAFSAGYVQPGWAADRAVRVLLLLASKACLAVLSAPLVGGIVVANVMHVGAGPPNRLVTICRRGQVPTGETPPVYFMPSFTQAPSKR